jgi:hypothetical protein
VTKDEIKKQAQEAKLFLAQGREVKGKPVAFMLRSCDADMSAYNGFKWPKAGPVSCPDWDSRATCGYGLHGLLWGEGDVTLTAMDQKDAQWLVCAVWSADVVGLGAKVKVPRAFVVFCGSRHDAVAKLQRLGAKKSAWGTATAGDSGTATAGVRGTATAGDSGTATAGVRGTATAGVRGTATAGDSGTATAGYGGTATAGYGGTATAGEDGVICILRWNGKRYKPVFANVGENGIEPNVGYRLDQNGCFVRADGKV